MNKRIFTGKRLSLGILILLHLFYIQLLAQSPVPSGAEVEKVADGFLFTEGPVWRSAGYLVFSDIQANTIYKWTEEGGKEVYLTPSGKSNGLAEDLQGRLILCQHRKRRVARIDSNGTETAIATHYDGKKLNSPNDLTIKSDGSIYFTDPPYGIDPPEEEELGFYGIYRLTPEGELILLDKSLIRPNGIAFSTDETKLYVNDSQAAKIYVWDVQPDLTIANKRLFYSMTGGGAADGMKIDTEGNIYSTGPGAVWIFKPDGTLIDKIPVPEEPANVAWGDADYQTLYITARTGLYRIHLNAKGYKTNIKPRMKKEPTGFKLFNNYPNPFNPGTTISFELALAGKVRLDIYNVLGRQVSSVIDAFLPAGRHRINWEARDLTAGTYFGQLYTNTRQETVRMVLMK